MSGRSYFVRRITLKLANVCVCFCAFFFSMCVFR